MYSMDNARWYTPGVLAPGAIPFGFFFVKIKDSNSFLLFFFQRRFQKCIYPVVRIVHCKNQVRIYTMFVRSAYRFNKQRHNNLFSSDIHICYADDRPGSCIWSFVYEYCKRMFQNFRKNFQRFMQTMRMILFMKLPVILSEFLRRIVIQTQMSCVHHDRKRRKTNLPHYFRRCTDKHRLTLILLRRIDDARQSFRKRNLIIRSCFRSIAVFSNRKPRIAFALSFSHSADSANQNPLKFSVGKPQVLKTGQFPQCHLHAFKEIFPP